jgi:hypothetical protein
MAINEQGEGGQASQPEIIEHASRMVGEAKAFGRALSDTGARINSSLDLAGRVQRNPIGSVLVAAGIGYVLGGGLFSRTTGRALKLGVRLALIPFIKGQISALTGSEGSQAGEPL